MTIRVGLDASAAAVHAPTGVAVAIRSLALALRALPLDERPTLEVLYRLSRLRRRRTFLEGARVFHDRFSWLLARRLEVFHGPDARLPRFSGPALVATVHDLSVRKDARFATDGFRATRAGHWEDTVRRAELVVTYTDAVRRELARELGYPLERIAVVPLAAPPLLAPTEAGRRAARARAGLSPGDEHVLVLGELSARKNARTAIEAFGAARSGRVRRAKLLLVGPDGHGAGAVRDAAAAQGERVRVLGWVPEAEKAALLADARALLFPSRSEGFGLPLLEALRAGVPVVASTEPSLVEVAGGAALHEDPDDVAGLASALDRACGDEALRAERIARGRAREAAFTWDGSARALARVYRAAAARDPRALTLPEKKEPLPCRG